MFSFYRAASDTQGWIGAIIRKADIPQSDGTIKAVMVLGFKTPYQYKDEVKELVQKHGGTWNAFYRFWFIPLNPERFKGPEAQRIFCWNALKDFHDLGIIKHPIVDITNMSDRNLAWFKKQNKKDFGHLQAVPEVISIENHWRVACNGVEGND